MSMPLLCRLRMHAWPQHVNAYTQAPARITCFRGCGKEHS